MRWRDQRVLITGANGFAGSNAVRHFLKLGAKVTAVVHRHDDQIADLADRIEIKKADLLNSDEAIKVCSNQVIVLNFAASDGSLEYKAGHSADLFADNLRINLNLFDAAVKQQVKIFLLVSSSDIYSSRVELLDEDSPIEINWQNKVDGYKLAKWASELASREYVKQYGLNFVVVRPSNLYGPGDEFEDDSRLRLIPNIIKRSLTHQPVEIWGNGQQTRSFLYVEDFLKICQRLIEKGVFNSPVNVAAESSVTLAELARIIGELTGKSIEVVIDPTKNGGAKQRLFDLAKLNKMIGQVNATDQRIGLIKTIKFYRQHYPSHD